MNSKKFTGFREMVVTPQETFLTLDEACEALRCSPNTLRALAASGKLGFKVGKEYGFTATQLSEFVRREKECGSTRETVSGKSICGSTAQKLDEALKLAIRPRPLVAPSSS